VDEVWVTQLIGERAVQEIKADATRRADAELARKGIEVPTYANAPQPANLYLSDAALSYWNAVEEAQKAEPELRWYKPVAIMRRLTKIKLRMPKQIVIVGRHIAFTPKLNKRDQFVADLQRIVEAYERLPDSERAKFTTDGAPEMGGLRFPRPIRLAEADNTQAVYRKAAREVDAIRAKATRQAWLDGLDKALGRGARGYNVGGRVRWEREGSDEQST
jgi:hypothetical protein